MKSYLNMHRFCPVKQLFSCLQILMFSPLILSAQMITGTWHGKINGKNVELKIVQQGDSLTGNSRYYESENSYRKYSIRGYFDQNTNEAVWWDDRLLEIKTGKSIFTNKGSIPYLAVADFNCPGSNKMYLDGKASEKNDVEKRKGPVHLEKVNYALFSDEWDFVIENYTAGANDPYIIDSVKTISLMAKVEPVISNDQKTVKITEPKTREKEMDIPVETTPAPVQEPVFVKAPELTIEEKFIKRKKETMIEIPVTGDSVELRFYDNAEVDGDSISLFLDGKLVFEHIRLKASPFTIKLAISELKESSELVMVAENLGEIPPNTAYMIVYNNNERFDASLLSTEETSAVIKLVKPKTTNAGLIPD